MAHARLARGRGRVDAPCLSAHPPLPQMSMRTHAHTHAASKGRDTGTANVPTNQLGLTTFLLGPPPIDRCLREHRSTAFTLHTAPSQHTSLRVLHTTSTATALCPGAVPSPPTSPSSPPSSPSLASSTIIQDLLAPRPPRSGATAAHRRLAPERTCAREDLHEGPAFKLLRQRLDGQVGSSGELHMYMCILCSRGGHSVMLSIPAML